MLTSDVTEESHDAVIAAAEAKQLAHTMSHSRDEDQARTTRRIGGGELAQMAEANKISPAKSHQRTLRHMVLKWRVQDWVADLRRPLLVVFEYVLYINNGCVMLVYMDKHGFMRYGSPEGTSMFPGGVGRDQAGADSSDRHDDRASAGRAALSRGKYLSKYGGAQN